MKTKSIGECTTCRGRGCQMCVDGEAFVVDEPLPLFDEVLAAGNRRLNQDTWQEKEKQMLNMSPMIVKFWWGDDQFRLVLKPHGGRSPKTPYIFAEKARKDALDREIWIPATHDQVHEIVGEALMRIVWQHISITHVATGEVQTIDLGVLK